MAKTTKTKTAKQPAEKPIEAPATMPAAMPAAPKRKMASGVIRALCIRRPELTKDKIRAMAEAEVGAKINDITFLGHYDNARYMLRAISDLGFTLTKTPAK